MKSTDRWLFLFMKSTYCSCRCRHCDFAVSRIPVVPWRQTEAMLQPFVDTQRAGTHYGNLAVLLGDAPLNLPDLPAGLRYLRDYQIEGWYSVPANGFRQRSLEHWQPFLQAVHEVGTTILEFTLYGQRETHDWFARRPGDYDAIHRLADLWHQLGGQTMWSLVVHRRNLNEVTMIRQEIKDRYSLSCPAVLWNFLGFGVSIEELRPDTADLARLDTTVQKELADYLPESKWYNELQHVPDLIRPAEPKVMHAVLHADGQVTIPYTPAAQGHAGVIVSQGPIVLYPHF